MTKKKSIEESLEIRYELEGPINRVIDKLKELRSQGWQRLTFDYSRGYYDSIDIEVKVYKTRLETDEEEQERAQREEYLKSQREEKERMMLAELLNKYGKPEM